MDPASRELVEQLVEAGLQANLITYMDLRDSDPDAAWLAASAMRIIARQGCDARAIPALGAALDVAPDPACFTHLAKALAAFGREAGDESDRIVAYLNDLLITDDGLFWAFDSGLHALSFTGGPIAEGFVMLLAEESPTRVARSHGVYRGDLSAADRDAWFASSLQTVQEKLAEKDPGKWTKKLTEKAFEPSAAPEKMSPWMTR